MQVNVNILSGGGSECTLGIGQGEQADEIGSALVGVEHQPNGVDCMRLCAGSCAHMQTTWFSSYPPVAQHLPQLLFQMNPPLTKCMYTTMHD